MKSFVKCKSEIHGITKDEFYEVIAVVDNEWAKNGTIAVIISDDPDKIIGLDSSYFE